ncbi:MAG: hypothetical protein F7O42_12540 [Opitutae bacterium]|nr:hypothetical protein [Opitutae bacterium]
MVSPCSRSSSLRRVPGVRSMALHDLSATTVVFVSAAGLAGQIASPGLH